MSEQVYQQVDDAIVRNLYISLPDEMACGHEGRKKYWLPTRIECGDIVIDYLGCGGVPSRRISPDQWSEAVSKRGLFRRFGIWSFTSSDDPAAGCIAYCERYPHSAGEELHRLRELVKDPPND